MKYIKIAFSSLLIILISGCGYGIIGKKTTAAIQHLDKDVNTSIGLGRDTVVKYFVQTRDSLLNYLRMNSLQEAHDLSIGLLQGTVGYLDEPANRDRLALLFDSLITHAGAAARVQLIKFKDDLLDDRFIAQVRALLRGVMNELIQNPVGNLLNVALSDHTRRQLDYLLQMIVPAILNDSAIGQLGKLKNVLLGVNMKKDIASWTDTMMVVANERLDHTFRPTIKSIVEENSGVIRRNAGWIITGLCILVIVVSLAVFFIQQKRVNLSKSLLHQVTVQIENLKQEDRNSYNLLTNNIHQAMLNHELEGKMSGFLRENGISNK